MMNCAVFASGQGSNFDILLQRKKAGDLHVNFVLMVGNNSSAGVFEKARKYGIEVLHCSPSHYLDEKEYCSSLIEKLEEKNVQLIVLAGYMKKLPAQLVHHFKEKIINIHPSLLPAFGGKGMYGSNVHKAVLDYGSKVTGVTVHFVDEEYDHGPVIIQEPVRVFDTDTCETLAARVLATEHAVYWKAVEAIACGHVRIQGRKVVVNA
ncbi:phosphoribosylglycinamide formyltransferase [Chitinispirillales bacterium ANBcel5]|uniref:phosphoribosylglycinamide formyltransferase n=1 Tax=Cellulosispirillum alkaliphilum TaxID=3039283 RepID=UPI002A552F69|nr:phosphoribosylglycinamide formyltransferase [Chitinispirillales bacterium ANBcel5]